DCIIKIINNGGDADTIAAIAGGLLGCIYGYNSIPKRWIDVLDGNVKNELDKLSNIVINRRVLFDKTK
ncbi:MAG: ADP-ribosylglycohydrolase family protein, partial [bacterium]